MIIEHGKPISIDDVIKICDHYENVSLDNRVLEDIETSRRRLITIKEKGRPVYGINTGYGIFANKTIDESDTEKLNHNLIISHAVGIGEPLPERIVRAAMFIRAVTLAKGYSGVSPVLIYTLLEMINSRVLPIIPSKGSLGSSGDLCQLSHLGLVISRDESDLDEESGKAIYRNEILSGKQAMHAAKIDRLILSSKEGLALNNGATFSAAIAALCVYEAEYLIHVAEIATALTMEALCARSNVLDTRLHKVRNQYGQNQIAENISLLIRGSTFLNSIDKVQDAYSIRCAPQVQGPALDTVLFVKNIIEKEINAVTDNPLIFDSDDAISGGNFHGEAVAMVMDYLAIAMCEIGAISERRTSRLVDEKMNYGLPPMLVDDQKHAGLNSGVMMLQYTAASLVLENQTLATPDSIRSLPTSAGQEDLNANAMTASRHAYEIIENLKHILSIEIYTAVRAINLRKRIQKGKLGKGTEKIFNLINEKVTYKPGDTLWIEEINKVSEMIGKRELPISGMK